MRYKIEMSYRGSAYCGWQRQPNARSVQQTLEEALGTLFRMPVAVVGAGRTDTGVNASYYVAHFDVPSAAGLLPPDVPLDCGAALFKLNYILPEDIAVQSFTPAAPDFHARFDAVAREYHYFISPRKDPFTRASTWQYYVPLDVASMNCAAAHLLANTDFTSFAKLGSNNKTNTCHVTAAAWEWVPVGHTAPADGSAAADFEILRFRIRADRFLRNMVRSLVGTLVDVGRGKYTPEQFRDIMEAKDLSRSSAGAPAQGLFLADIEY